MTVTRRSALRSLALAAIPLPVAARRTTLTLQEREDAAIVEEAQKTIRFRR